MYRHPEYTHVQDKQLRKHRHLGLFALGLGLSWCSWCYPSYSLPGQSVDDAKTWMQGHPTLQADSREGLRVQRVTSPARRFTFRASIFPIGGLQPPGRTGVWSRQQPDFNVVRREEFILVDYDEPVTLERLEDSLRTVYGADIYADYRRAIQLDPPKLVNLPNQSDVRRGNLYVYWLEITADANGTPTIGRLNVVLPEDLEQLQTHLQRQSQ